MLLTMDQKEKFNLYCKERFLEKCLNSKTVSKEKGEKVVKYLKGELPATEIDAVFKHWISRKGFKLVDYPPLGLKDVLCLPAKNKICIWPDYCWVQVSTLKHTSFRTLTTQQSCLSGEEWPLWRISLTFSLTSTAKRRGTLEQKRLLLRCFMITLQDIHMYLYLLKMQVSKLYECLPRSAVDKFVQLCVVCHSSKPQTTRAPLKPIVSSGFMSRGQVGSCILVVCATALCFN